MDIKINNIKAINTALANLSARVENVSPALASIGEYLKRVHDDRHKAGVSPDMNKWKPIDTIAKASRTNSKRPLVDTGMMLNMVYQTSQRGLSFGTTAAYAVYHQEGTKNLPKREILGMNASDENSILDRIGDYLI